MISKLKTSLLVLLVTAINSGVFAQNTNPYEKFGYVSKVEYKLPMEDLFRIINTDTTSEIKSMVIDFENHIAYLLGEKDALITEFIIDPQEVLTWLSPDPKAHKYPHQSPYAYCSNNPVMKVDPDGMEDDWFMNQKTGDIYYNSAYRAKDAGQIDGTSNWVHLGANGMFGANPNGYNVQSIGQAGTNYPTANAMSADLSQLLNNPLLSGGSWTGGGNYETMIKGNNAQTFMSNMGYNYVPQDYIYNENLTITVHPEPHGMLYYTDNNSTSSVITNQYVPKNYYKRTTIMKQGQVKRTPISIFPYSYNERSKSVRRDTYGRGNPNSIPIIMEGVKNVMDLWHSR
jgi:hypothetical protein